jgi:predicted small secreted protein
MRSLVALLIAACVLLAGCNTMEGLGQDIEAAGQGIKNKAQQKKGY